jgi:SAM-dependent methyltransferase
LALAGCAGALPVPQSEDIVARSRAALAAMDRRDVAAVTATLADGYVHFEGDAPGDAIDRDRELKALRTAGPGVATRTWSDERVFGRPGSATFIGKAHERQAGNDRHGGGYTFDGWYTLTWVADGAAWKLAYVAYKAILPGAQSATWNQIFAHDTGFEHAPNKLLVDSVRGGTPGAALDVAMGQGRNALALAALGWHVTGVDISEEGVHQARAAAAARGLGIDTVITDLATYDYGVAKYDLVAMIYAYPALDRLADVQRAVKPGGLFVYEFFAKGPHGDLDAPEPGKLARQFADGWDVLRDDVVDDVPDWRDDRATIERFVARKR